eukprot:11535146-Alexandrium_andersonii.AAC.1
MSLKSSKYGEEALEHSRYLQAAPKSSGVRWRPLASLARAQIGNGVALLVLDCLHGSSLHDRMQSILQYARRMFASSLDAATS